MSKSNDGNDGLGRNKRRIILISISAAGAASAVGIPLSALAQAQSKSEGKSKTQESDKAQSGGPKLDENDPQAVSLGYRHDTTKVDQKKFPKHEVAQKCGDCQFFQGAASQPWAPCTVFGNKQVSTKGWCSAYVKKAK